MVMLGRLARMAMATRRRLLARQVTVATVATVRMVRRRQLRATLAALVVQAVPVVLAVQLAMGVSAAVVVRAEMVVTAVLVPTRPAPMSTKTGRPAVTVAMAVTPVTGVLRVLAPAAVPA